MKQEKDKIFGLERNVFFTGLTSFFTDTSTKMVYSVMPLFLLSIAEDVLQNMYIKLWMAREKLATVQNPEAYCIATLKNSCLDILRSPRVLCNDNNIEGYDYPDQTTNAETEIVYKETVKRIKSIIHRLPAKQQKIIDLRVFCDCSTEEIEQITGESSENVRVLLSRARNTLRMKLKR